MKYEFNYYTTGFDIWKLSMYRVYSSLIGVTNGIFTFAMIILSVRFWADANSLIRAFLVLGISLFTFIQPVLVYLRAQKQAENIPENLTIGFDDDGLHISNEEQNSFIGWDQIDGLVIRSSMVILFSKNKEGFILSNRVLGEKKESFYKYALTKISKKNNHN